MKILIIETVWMGQEKYGFFDKTLLTTFSILPTLYARQIAAITPKKHTVIVINERYQPIDYNEKYDLININYTTSTAPHAYQIADTFREKGISVVLSGLHASALPEEAKQHADSILLGRGEMNWLKLLEDFENNNLQPLYQPISYDSSTYIPPVNIALPGFRLTGAIEATRGCPYKCEFCPEIYLSNGSSFYKRPISDVIEELRSIPQKTIMFYDASLTIDPTYTKQLFKKIKPLRKRFFCNGNVDVLANDLRLVKLSKDAGCIAWLIGFESISQVTIDKVGKKTNKVDDYMKAVENIHNNRMAVIGCFMFGFDTDHQNVFQDTLEMIQQSKIDICDFCVLTPFPGTPLYKQLKKEGRIITDEWEK